MFKLSEKFSEQYPTIQQQFNEWTPLEQLYSSVELTNKLQLSYRYYLSQLLFQANIQQENNDMFHHTVHQANAPAILACLLSEPVDKIISTLQLYLPLVSTTTTNEKLLDSYRDIFIYLDSKLLNPSNFSYNEQQLINHCQLIKFFIQTNPCLQKCLVNIPRVITLASSSTTTTSTQMINKGNIDEKLSQRHHQPLQRYSSVRPCQQLSASPPSGTLMNFSSEGSQNSSTSQQLIRTDASDSGVDLSEPGMTNSVHNLLSSHNQQHAIIGRSHSANLSFTNGQDNQHNHPFVAKTASSPTPEQTSSNRSTLVPLSAVLSAPSQSIHSYYSDFHHQNNNYQQQIRPTLTVSDEDDPESQGNSSMNNNTTDYSKRLRPFISLCTPNTRNKPNNNVRLSPYLDVDDNSGSVRNTFIQPNSGMRDVPKWLKNLRLHKYAFFFSQMTFDQMMNLTIDQLKERSITDGACTKILLNIKKLKERETLLQQCLIDMDNGQIDIKTVLQHLHDLMLTPIRTKQIEQDNDNEEDLPKLIMQVLEKVYQQLTSNTSSTTILSEMGNNLVGLFDRCYKHEAFSLEQRAALLRWRGPLCNKLQTSGKIEFKSMQSSSSSSSSSTNRRVQLKPQTSMGNMNTTQLTKPPVRIIKSTVYYTNYQSSITPLSRQHNSESQNLNYQSSTIPLSRQHNSESQNIDSNIIRRPNKSPTFVFTTNDDSNEDKTSSTHHLSIVSSHSLQEQSSYQQSTPFITERSGNGSGNLRPSFNYNTSTPQRTNGGYLAANQHQLLTRKTSIDPYGESMANDKTKLCKTFSDPSKIRFYNPTQTPTNPQSSSSTLRSPISSQPPMHRIMSSPYSQQQYLSHSSTDGNSNTLDSLSINEAMIQKSYSDKEESVFYGNDNKNKNNNTISSSNDSNTHDIENSYNQRHNSTEIDTFYRQLTESAICDDVHDSLSDHHKDELSNIQYTKSSSNSSTDTEQ